MIRRLTTAALAGLVCVAAVAGPASAFTRVQAICVRNARADAKDALSKARDDIRKNLTNQYAICLNDKTGCVTQCVVNQATCLAVPAAAVRLCEKVDNGPNDPGPDDTSCQTKNSADIALCRQAAPADQVQCVEDAQLALFNCNQVCVAQHQDEVIACSGEFSDCLERCSQ